MGNETGAEGIWKVRCYATLDEAVRMQTVSDVPVGLFLSGGIDSSSLAGILSRAGTRLNTFSIIFREADYSEAEYSRAVARVLRLTIRRSWSRSAMCSTPSRMRSRPWTSPPSTA